MQTTKLFILVRCILTKVGSDQKAKGTGSSSSSFLLRKETDTVLEVVLDASFLTSSLPHCKKFLWLLLLLCLVGKSFFWLCRELMPFNLYSVLVESLDFS